MSVRVLFFRPFVFRGDEVDGGKKEAGVGGRRQLPADRPTAFALDACASSSLDLVVYFPVRLARRAQVDSRLYRTRPTDERPNERTNERTTDRGKREKETCEAKRLFPSFCSRRKEALRSLARARFVSRFTRPLWASRLLSLVVCVRYANSFSRICRRLRPK